MTGEEMDSRFHGNDIFFLSLRGFSRGNLKPPSNLAQFDWVNLVIEVIHSFALAKQRERVK
jgi:hypothetical protein